MTYQQFLENLKRTPRRWVISGGRIRQVPNFTPLAQCPISAVCTALTGRQLIAGDWREAADLIGLDKEVSRQIMETGDGGTPNYGFYSEEVRKDLLQATGLRGGVR